MTDRIRFALLFLVVAACVLARVGGAFGASHIRHVARSTKHVAHKSKHAAHAAHHVVHRTAAHQARHVSHATLLAREQAKIVTFARRFIGVPYSWGGTSPGSGFDCSGFTRFVYAHFGISLPHYSVAQFDLGRRVSRAGLRPGDLVFFDGLGHVGLYIGGNRFIHAPHTGTDVQISSLSGSYGSGYDGARRVL